MREKERTMNEVTPNNTPEKNKVVASRFTACNKPRYASAEAASALPGFLCFVQRHIACV
jgi:hypothetical protein